VNSLPNPNAFHRAVSAADAVQRDAAVRVEDLSKTYDPAAGPVLDRVTLAVRAGDIHGVIGRSGAGKSTLVRCLNGLVRPSSGRIWVSGREITGLSGAALREARRGIAMIFQHFSLLSSRTAAGNVALPLEIAGVPRAEIRSRVPRLLDLVGLAAKADSFPSELSGGQKQRVGIARALALDPKVLLSDEATSALDPETTEQILDLIKSINRRLGLTVVLITHEMDVVRRIANQVTVLEAGRIAETGSTFETFAFPRSAVGRSFLASIVAHDLPPEVSARLVAAPRDDTDPVLRITFTGEAAHEPVLADLASRFGLRPNILHGRIDYIDGRPLGVLALRLEGGAAKVGAVLSHLSTLGLHGEVVGHAVRSSAGRARAALP
jgi:D-methionine transport system ATP-binding protein